METIRAFFSIFRKGQGRPQLLSIPRPPVVACLLHMVPSDHHLAKIRKVNKDFARELDFEDIKFPVRSRNNHKISK